MNINKQVTSKECFTTIFRARRSLVYCQYIVWFTLLRARASPCVLTRPSSCALLRLQGHTRGQWGQESLNALGGENRGRVSSSQGIYPMRATRILAARFRGGGVLRCLNPIWSYTYCCAYMHFQNSQGGRSWKAPFSTVARVASRRNHVHCHVHQDTHSCPLHTLQRKEKQIKVCNDWVTKSKTEKKKNKQSWNKGTFFPSFLITCLSMETRSIPGAFL